MTTGVNGFNAKRVLKACVTTMLLLLLTTAIFVQSVPVKAAGTVPNVSVTVHYFRPDNTYDQWNLWMWNIDTAGNGHNGASYNFTSQDSYGAVATLSIPPDTNQTLDTAQVGFIVRKGDWLEKDIDFNRFINIANGKGEVWLVSGDPNVYTTLNDALDARKPHVVNAFLENNRTVVAQLSNPITFPYAPTDASAVDTTSGKSISVNSVTPYDPSKTTSSNLVTIKLNGAPDVTHIVDVDLKDFKAKTIIPRNVLNLPQYTYKGDDLGNRYDESATTFRVWAPTASDVKLQLFNSESGPLTKTVAMHKGDKGTWQARVRGNLQNWYYLYQVTVQGQTQTAVDPYATAIAVNGTRTMIVDLHDTNPAGWRFDTHKTPAQPEDAVIYEVHTRDFTINPNSGVKNNGKFLAFTETGTKGPGGVSTGVDSLKELGVTDVQIMPAYGFASIDENNPNQYNWGYDPRNYNVPEGAYATTPHGTTRITEFKQMVQSLHKQGLGVIMDVVYNHTFTTKISDFDKIVPGYYYRTDFSGAYTNGSGTGNEIAAERPMVQKFILDSVKYWVNEYHVDGFRFDLMALLGVDTMKKISTELHEINPGILIHGEPWTGGTSALPANQLLTKGQQKGLNLAVFNDNLRNGLDGNVFDKSAQGFATGATGLTDVIKKGVEGSINDFTASPRETINYVTSHDNMTLWDKIAASNPNDSVGDRIKMDELAQAVVMTSQGIPFMQGGEEMLRSKGGNDNSYNAGDAVNQFDWSLKEQHKDVFNYYAGLIKLRDSHPAFRMTTADQIKDNLVFLNSPDNTVAFMLKDHANHDAWKNIMVVYNPNKTAANVTLPSGNWNIVGTANTMGQQVLDHATTSATVPPISTMVLYQN
ncbi:type I pullulanase [Dictyobacter aurantiacus]|uniref:pullulanase n=1 Tax=Dictyobacter aurantiacus TaxID=1936993 RepID=A0A401ZPD1_9CHLR|nr:type I pullulanase [Dictyobacter aurantiacus]GCE08768.1 pullulanase [Dictyobacter aurantiacus]